MNTWNIQCSEKLSVQSVEKILLKEVKKKKKTTYE